MFCSMCSLKKTSGKMGTKGQNAEALRRILSAETLAEEPLVSQEVGLREAPELGHASRWCAGPRRHQWLFVRSPRQVGVQFDHDEEL